MFRKIMVIVGILICAMHGAAARVTAADFSADVVGQSEEGAFQGKMYVQGKNVRMEMEQMVTVTRMDQKVVWMIMPSERMYMEQPVKPRDVIASGAAEGEVERKPLGQEAVDGKPADKFEVTYDYEGDHSLVYEWVDPSLGMPVKIAAVDGSWSMEYHNIQMGPQEASLFEIPDGYQKFAMPSTSF